MVEGTTNIMNDNISNNIGHNNNPRSNSLGLSMETGGTVNAAPEVTQAQRMLSTIRPGAAAAAAMHSEVSALGGADTLGASHLGDSPLVGAMGHGRTHSSYMHNMSSPSHPNSDAFSGSASAFSQDNAFPKDDHFPQDNAAAIGMGSIDPSVTLLARERQILMERQLLEERRLASRNAAAGFGGAQQGPPPSVLSSGVGAAYSPQPLNARQEEILLMRRELDLRRDLQALQQHRLRMQHLRVQEQRQQAVVAAAAARAAASGLPQQAHHQPGAVLSGRPEAFQACVVPGAPSSPGFAAPQAALRRDSPPPAVPAASSSSPGAHPQSPSKIQQLLEIATQVEGAKEGIDFAKPSAAGAAVAAPADLEPSPLLPGGVVAGTPPPAKAYDGASAANSSKKYGSPPGGTASQRKQKRARTFAMKLMDALVHRKNDEAVAWLPDGKSFVIIDSFKFMREVYPYSFKECKYESFVRKLNQWGFTRLTSGTGVDCFSHKYFQRDRIDLVMEMRCLDWRVRRRDARASGEGGK